jgi:hypothetical protein
MLDNRRNVLATPVSVSAYQSSFPVCPRLKIFFYRLKNIFYKKNIIYIKKKSNFADGNITVKKLKK